jgi:serine protease Do
MICLNDKKEIGTEPAEIENCGRSGHNLGKIVLLFILLIVIGCAIVALAVYHYITVRDVPVGDNFAASPIVPFAEDKPIALEPSGEDLPGDVRLDIVPRPNGELQPLSALYEKLAPSVVAVQSGSGDTAVPLGTGIVISADGYILTCGHLLENARSVNVLCADGMEYAAVLAGFDNVSDLALLQIRAIGLTPAEFGSSGTSTTGEAILSIGDPIGTVQVLTTGILSAIVPDIRVNGFSMPLLMTDIANAAGHSGAPVFNYYGQVIGVGNARLKIKDGTKLFAIPAEMVTSIVSDLSEYGRVPGRPALNADIRDLQPGYADFLGLPPGAYVVSAPKDSVLRKGDIITAIDGFTVTSTADLNAYINSKTVGDSVTLTLVRGREYAEVTTELVDR